MKEWLRVAVSRDVLKIALRTSIVVGLLLNAINHGAEVLDDPALVPALPVILNFCVPYAVATYGAVSFARRR